MTKWKFRAETLIMMHAHNQWSKWKQFQIEAADELGIPVCRREFENHFDRSLDQEWIVPLGTARIINDRATELQRASWSESYL